MSSIDITDLVENLRQTFVTAAQTYIMGLILAVPGFGPVAAWFTKVFLGPFLTWVLNKISTWSVMQAFFLNTSLRKSGQAGDYLNAKFYKENLPVDATNEVYAEAEQKEIAAFNEFVCVTT